MAVHPSLAAEMRATPDYPTMLKQVLGEGVCIGIARGEVWLYRAVPLKPVKDIRNTTDLHQAASAIHESLEGLAALSKNQLNNRGMSQAGYRGYHMLLTNVPRLFRPAAESPLYAMLTEHMGNRIVHKRQLLFGVPLIASTKSSQAKGFFDTARRVVEVIAKGFNIEDYADDFAKVSFILERAGLTVPTSDEIALADSWWNLGRHNMTPFLPHTDHLHVFNNTDSLKLAERAGYGNCKEWDYETVPGVIDLTLTTVAEADLDGVDGLTEQALWVQELLQINALAVSVRGRLEPMKVTRDTIRKQIKKWDADETERTKANKRARIEQQDMIAETTQLEGFYASKDSPATSIDTSVIVALDGRIDDIDAITANSSIRLAPMEARQGGAFVEMMMCSPSRQNPRLHQWPTHLLAYSGVAGLTAAGDVDEPMALLGFTEHDNQPVGLSPIASSRADAAPMMLVNGATGSGKQMVLSTPIPTPTGWTTIGELVAGTKVLGRDGNPCNVTHLSPIDETPNLYRMSLSDGQHMLVDGNHQFVASSFADRHRHKSRKRASAISRWDTQRQVAESLMKMASAAGDEWVTRGEIVDLISSVPNVAWSTPDYIGQVLDFMDCPSRDAVRTTVFHRKSATFTTPQTVNTYPSAEAIDALVRSWSPPLAQGRWPQAAAKLAAAAIVREKVVAGDLPAHMSMRDILEHVGRHGGQVYSKHNSDHGQAVMRRNDVAATTELRNFTQTAPLTHDAKYPVVEYQLRAALWSLAERLHQQHNTRPGMSVEEQVVTTGEMLQQGVRANNGMHTNWAIRTTDPLILDEADLALDPYVMGAWLGDGSSTGKALTGIDSHIWEAFDAAGFPTRLVGTSAKEHSVKGLRAALLAAGMQHVPGATYEKLDKRIPVTYLRASHGQRLALLQGLMDTDGTISITGSCEISLSKPDLAADVLELIHTLGIKANSTVNKAGYRDTEGNHVECADRTRIKFTTTLPVFQLPRKAERIPTQVRETQHWLYVTNIEPVLPGDDDYEPACCITVDSPDHTYLCAGFVPTHNTVLLQWLAAQFAEIPTSRGEYTPIVVINPKSNSDMSGMVNWAISRTGHGQVYNLDNLLQADGVFDPIRFSRNREVGLELAMAAILSINPFGSNKIDMELPLSMALRLGVDGGATCIGQALEIALTQGADPVMVNQILAVTDSMPKARAIIGRNPHGASLNVAGGLTLIQVGDTQLSLEEGGESSLTTRVDMTLLQLMVQGSAAALAHRDGVVAFDEAWVFAKGAGSALEALGRTAREMRVMMMLFNQRPSELASAGMENYVSRSFTMHLDETEAFAAHAIAKVSPTPQRIERMRAVDGLGSMKAVIKPNREVVRGSVGMYVGMDGRPVMTEVVIPSAFFKFASTNAAEKGDRKL